MPSRYFAEVHLPHKHRCDVNVTTLIFDISATSCTHVAELILLQFIDLNTIFITFVANSNPILASAGNRLIVRD